MIFKPHSLKQENAIFSDKPITILATGIQYGKTTVGAMRMKILMHKFTDSRDNFLITAPTYKIMQQATLPEFLRVMKDCGEYSKSDSVFRMHNGGTCWMRTATDPDSVVGITDIRGVWGDEAGLYSLYFHENIQARASIKEAPIIYTTSPYSLNWIYSDYIRPKIKGKCPIDSEIIQAKSNENPYFPAHEFERKRMTMDPRRFNMIYGGEFHKIEGLVYDCFDQDSHCVPWKELDHKTVYVAGVDWGFTNPSVICVLGVTPKDGVFLVHEFYKTGQTINDLVEMAKKLKKVFNIERFYCDPSSPHNISEFNKHKLTAIGADNDIRPGIDAFYELIRNGKFHAFEGKCPHFLDEVSIYHYPAPNDIGSDKDVKEQMPVKQHDHTCLVGDSKIMTKKGLKNIDDIVSGEFVLTPLGFKEVIDSSFMGIKEVYRLGFEGGYLDLTDDHPVFDGRRFMFDAPRYCDTIVKCDLTVKSIILMATIGGVLALFERLQSIYIGKFGNSITVISLLVSTFIIKTLIKAIMIFQTLKLWMLKSIYRFMVNLSKGQFRKKLWMRRQYGMEAKKAINSINGLENTLITLENKIQKRSHVNVVRDYSNARINPNIARIIVSRSIDVSIKLITFFENVPFVSKIFSSIVTLKPDVVPSSVVGKLGEKAVYNLTVKDAGCYFANNILVSNCDALRYPIYALSKTKGYFNKRSPVSPSHKDIDYRLHVVDDMLIKGINNTEYDW